jgi:hypothetical protein
VPPEQLLLTSLQQAFYGIRSERLLLEQLNYNLLFRCYGFAGPSATSASTPTTPFGIRPHSPRIASGFSMTR